MTADPYIRNAFVTKVVDGDTFDAEVDLGFTCNVKVRFRLRGFDAPEIYRPKTDEEEQRGLIARDRVIDLINNQKIAIKSYKMGVYNRWEADVILPDGRSLAEVLIAEGLSK